MEKISYIEIEEVNRKFEKFLEFVVPIFCCRCEAWIEDLENKQKETSYKKARAKSPHHNGIVNKYLNSKKPIKNNLDLFLNDYEHGFFHGLMTAFCAFLITNPSKKITEQGFDSDDFEKLFSSCILHDFVKCIEGNQSENHDKKLRDYFSDLNEETYGHNCLAEQYSDTALVMADRIELMRYSDYEDWTDERLTSAFNKLSEENQKDIKIFYLKIRPALENFYKKRNSIWIKHGLEGVKVKVGWESNAINAPKENINDNSTWPIKDSYYSPSSVEKQSENIKNGPYPIEQDRFPFSAHGHYPKGKPIVSRLSLGFCSNHNIGLIWAKLKGYIDAETFHEKGGVIVDSEARDHLYAKSKIKITDWDFVYNNLAFKDELNYNHENCCYPFDEKSAKDSQIIEILEDVINIPKTRVVKQNSIYLLWLANKLVFDRIVLLNLD